jgi:predicted RNA-binding Zn ribbon-like protein
MAVKTAKPFQLVAGNIALDLVNTLDYRFRESGPDELLATYDDLLRFALQSGLLSDAQVRKIKRMETSGAGVLKQVKELREALAAVAYALLDGKQVPNDDLKTLERIFKQASARRTLRTEGNTLTWGRLDELNVSAPLWLLAQQAEELLLSDRADHLRICAADTCRWLFLDTSKNHTRRWCDMKICGNRMKARRFQARKTTDEESA